GIFGTERMGIKSYSIPKSRFSFFLSLHRQQASAPLCKQIWQCQICRRQCRSSSFHGGVQQLCGFLGLAAFQKRLSEKTHRYQRIGIVRTQPAPPPFIIFSKRRLRFTQAVCRQVKHSECVDRHQSGTVILAKCPASRRECLLTDRFCFGELLLKRKIRAE